MSNITVNTNWAKSAIQPCPDSLPQMWRLEAVVAYMKGCCSPGQPAALPQTTPA